MTTETILSESALPADLTAKMLAHRSATAERCPICGVGRGRTCRNLKGETVPTHSGR